MTFTSRRSFAAVVRRAIRERTLVSYERDHWMGRTAVLRNGDILQYDPFDLHADPRRA